MKLSVSDLIYNKSKGFYSLPCKTYDIYYISTEWSGEDYWAALPHTSTKPAVYSAYLPSLCDKLAETCPEIFTEMWKLMHW